VIAADTARLRATFSAGALPRSRRHFSEDRLTALKSEYELAAKEPSNLRYGYVRAA
jgi:hypothetical protein